ncbi:MAG: GIY-YIG nuclease family protein [Balneolaceae bacterium]|nr:GIY-YIG nuclease family protein [Balneolaceae bacterium]MBO6546891.1 GIY-YIG nuclease family protein [Balneolaceae bacterium]MBO6649251.1 GIY-YIG nuclease family protein [Balneolaceae bacterium]
MVLPGMANTYYVYILSNYSKMLYVEVTNDLERRVNEHKKKLCKGYTRKYNLHQLVYYEETDDIRRAIEREKQLKGWRREKKTELIEGINPGWKDLAEGWYS